MHLVQILLPLNDKAGKAFPLTHYQQIRMELTKRFGGLTVFSRAPAEGLWKDQQILERDDIVIFEIMAETLDKLWWKSYRKSLEELFRQDEIVIRSHEMVML